MYYTNFPQGAIFIGRILDPHATSGDSHVFTPSLDYVMVIGSAEQEEATTLKALEMLTKGSKWVSQKY